MQLKIRLKTWPNIIVADEMMETYHHFYTLKCNKLFTRNDHEMTSCQKKPLFTNQCEQVTFLMCCFLLNNHSSLFMHWRLVFKVLLWMEIPPRGSLMAISVTMTAIGFLPPYLLNLFLFMLLRWSFTPHECCHPFPTLKKVWLWNPQKVHVFWCIELHSLLATWS